MVTPSELEQLPIFACLTDAERQRLADRAADVHLSEKEWLIRDGELPFFFVLLEGRLQLQKEVFGRSRQLYEYHTPGEFFGEVPILLGAPSFASVRALTETRLARFEAQQLLELIQNSPECSALILKTMTNRLLAVQQFAKDAPSARVRLVSTQYDQECGDIRRFLSANRIAYEWVDRDREPDRVPVCARKDPTSFAVVVDEEYRLHSPTVREVAQALGIRTTPRNENYDVVIAGAGPAGLAAGVYGASEGLRVLMVERAAAGGQAGTSSRIENYLGFPGGISGAALSERALKQAARFGAEIAMTRHVESVQPLGNGYCVQLDGGARVSTSVVVLATGVEWRILEADGVDRLQGRGVLYGASRDEAGNVIGKRGFIVGGGNSAGQAAVFFSNYAAEVTMLVRGKGLELTMSQYLITQIAGKGNIHIEPFTEVITAEGDDHLERVVTRTRPPEGGETVQTRDADAMFVMIGAVACTGWLPKEIECDAKGYICTGRSLTTWPLEREPFSLETSLP